jgi:hypothetical protein
MSIAQQIDRRVKDRAPLELFSPEMMTRKNESNQAVAKALSRMQDQGLIVRARKGVYYRPKSSRFGVIQPSEQDILKFLLFENGRRSGYITGLRLYNKLGLTSQISGVVEIATNEEKRSGNFLRSRVRYVKAYGDVRRDNIELLEILDTIKDSHRIPDASQENVLMTIARLIQDLKSKDQQDLLRLARKYPSRAKVTLAAIVESFSTPRKLLYLRVHELKSLVPNTTQSSLKRAQDMIP